MTTFDGWETQLYGDVMALPSGDELMHFRTKGSKNGVRRYQQPDGTWTPLGLKERKAREGWGESRREKRAEKKVAKAERRAAKAERKSAKTAERAQRMADLKERRRKRDLSKLSDEELRNKIARVKMEQEYKEMTRSPLLKSGEKAVSMLLDYKARKAESEANKLNAILENNKLKVDLLRTKADIAKARELTKQAKYRIQTSKNEAQKAAEEASKMREDRKAGLKIERKTALKKARTEARGAIRTFLKKRAENSAMSKKAWDQKQIEDYKKRKNAETIAIQNAQKEVQKTLQAQHLASQEQYKAAQEQHRASQEQHRAAQESEKWKSKQEKWKYKQEKAKSRGKKP